MLYIVLEDFNGAFSLKAGDAFLDSTRDIQSLKAAGALLMGVPSGMETRALEAVSRALESNSVSTKHGGILSALQAEGIVSAGSKTVEGDLSVSGNIFAGENVSPYAGQGGGWVDIEGPLSASSFRPIAPTPATLSAPHDFITALQFSIGDQAEFFGHIRHGIHSPTGLYLHVHAAVDGTDTQPIKFELKYTYAHGYQRQALGTPGTVTVEQTPDGTPKRHMILEITNPVLQNEIETDGLVLVNVERVTNGVTDNADPVFVLFVDAHARVSSYTSKERNYPFE